MNHAVQVIGDGPSTSGAGNGKASVTAQHETEAQLHVARSPASATRGSPPKSVPLDVMPRTPLQDKSNFSSAASPNGRSEADNVVPSVLKADAIGSADAPRSERQGSREIDHLHVDVPRETEVAESKHAGLPLPDMPPGSHYNVHSSTSMAGLPAKTETGDDVVNDILSLYSSSQGRQAPSPLTSLPLNHVSLYSSSGGLGIPMVGDRDPKRQTPTSFGGALRMSMNDVDVLGGGTPSLWGSSAGRASPANHFRGSDSLRMSMNDLDMLGVATGGPPQSIWASAAGRASPAQGSAHALNLRSSSPANFAPPHDLYSSARGAISSLDAHDPKRVTRSDVVSAQWPWEQQASLGHTAGTGPQVEPSAANLGIEAPKCGLGVRLRHSSRGLLSVATLLPGGPAHASGLMRENDQIIAVDGNDTFGKPIQQVARLFVGPEGSTVDLKICRDGMQPQHVQIVRKSFQHLTAPGPSSGSLAKADVAGFPPRAPTFSASAPSTFPSAAGISSASVADVGEAGGASGVAPDHAVLAESMPVAKSETGRHLSAVFEEAPHKARSLHGEEAVFQRPVVLPEHDVSDAQPIGQPPIPTSSSAVVAGEMTCKVLACIPDCDLLLNIRGMPAIVIGSQFPGSATSPEPVFAGQVLRNPVAPTDHYQLRRRPSFNSNIPYTHSASVARIYFAHACHACHACSAVRRRAAAATVKCARLVSVLGGGVGVFAARNVRV